MAKPVTSLKIFHKHAELLLHRHCGQAPCHMDHVHFLVASPSIKTCTMVITSSTMHRGQSHSTIVLQPPARAALTCQNWDTITRMGPCNSSTQPHCPLPCHTAAQPATAPPAPQLHFQQPIGRRTNRGGCLGLRCSHCPFPRYSHLLLCYSSSSQPPIHVVLLLPSATCAHAHIAFLLMSSCSSYYPQLQLEPCRPATSYR